MDRGRGWVFTHNNYSDQSYNELIAKLESEVVEYAVVGKELASTGTPHLQGYILFRVRRRFGYVRDFCGDGVHIARARGSPQQNTVYCCKEGDFVQFGDIPDRSRTGSKCQFADYCSWVSEYLERHGSPPNERAIAVAFPALYVRYSRGLLQLTSHLCPVPDLGVGTDGDELFEWQSTLEQELEDVADDRVVKFFVDPEGGKGKSWFQRYMYMRRTNDVQLLSVGKRDDLAHAIDVNKNIFLFNVPRGQMEFFQYSILEQLKDRVIFSPKYGSTTKIITRKCHVVVFSNEAPNEEKLSSDRFDIKYI